MRGSGIWFVTRILFAPVLFQENIICSIKLSYQEFKKKKSDNNGNESCRNKRDKVQKKLKQGRKYQKNVLLILTEKD